ncbi:LTA synthase family protein [Hymenobacter qilianensis]|uniref:hypothetical protein n=1 Tax=Hymenobacter qilianensis TaxID=1385715 RepID=UPI001CB9A1DA|nr:hypothetical protein [Hymenobacter qilianensis]
MPSPLLRLLLRRFALLLGVYVLLRAGFYWANQEVFREASGPEVVWAFWHGFRFDIAALLLLNLPFLLLSMVPRFDKGWQGLVRGVYLTLNATGMALNIIDSQYFKFIGRRTTDELFTITGDIQRQAGQLAFHYWFLVPPFVVLFGLLWYFYPMPTAAILPPSPIKSSPSRRLIRPLLAVVLIAALTVVGIRGGLQLKPLRTGHAFVQVPPVLGHLALNSTFTFLRSLGYQAVERRTYFQSDAQLQQALAPRMPDANPGAPRDNVVILLLESFSSEYTGIENGAAATRLSSIRWPLGAFFPRPLRQRPPLHRSLAGRAGRYAGIDGKPVYHLEFSNQ